jgi:hexulose-6-phosphate isomerase
MNLIGIMQGRLSPRPYPRLQAFPWNYWETEFVLAKQCQLDTIEWVFEADNYWDNPILSNDGIRKIRSCITETGVLVRTLCADYFMDHPFFRVSKEDQEKSIDILQKLIVQSARIGVQTILIPVLEVAEIRNQTDKTELKKALEQCLDTTEAANVKLGLETELPASEYLELVSSFNSPFVGAYYDTGNAAACGYCMRTDMELLRQVLVGIHVKDRKKGGSSVPLGSGDANFAEGIPCLCHQGYQGTLILQTFFDDDPFDTAKTSLQFVRRLMEQGVKIK